jgi:hypothetical protein
MDERKSPSIRPLNQKEFDSQLMSFRPKSALETSAPSTMALDSFCLPLSYCSVPPCFETAEPSMYMLKHQPSLYKSFVTFLTYSTQIRLHLGQPNKNRKAEQTSNRLAAKHSLKRIGTLGAMHHLAPFGRSCLCDRDNTHDR